MSVVYKLFTWLVLILTALFGTAITGFILGALSMYWILEEGKKINKNTPPPTP